MLGRINRLLESLSSHLALCSMLGGYALMTGLFGSAAWATKLLAPYAPFSWIAAAALGALVFTLVLLAAALARDYFISSSIKRRFYEQKERLNPLQDTFRQQRIALVDFVLPYDRVIKNKTFIECELIGPANMGMLATRRGAGAFTDCEYLNTAGAVVKAGKQIPAAIVLQDCHLLRCRLCDLVLLIPEQEYEHVKSGIPDLRWITPVPDETETGSQEASSPSIILPT